MARLGWSVGYRRLRIATLVSGICVLSGCSYLLRSTYFKPVQPPSKQDFEVLAFIASEREGIIGFGPALLPVIPWIDKIYSPPWLWKDLTVLLEVKDPTKGALLDLRHARVTMADGGGSFSPSQIDTKFCRSATMADGLYAIAPSNDCRIFLLFPLRPGDVKSFTIEPGAFSRDGEWIPLPATPYRRHSRVEYRPFVGD